MKSENQIKNLLEQYEFDRQIKKQYGIDKNNYTRSDLIIHILKWVLADEDNLDIDEVFNEYK